MSADFLCLWLLTVKVIISVALILTLLGIAAWIIELSLPDKSVLLIALLRGSGLCIAVWGIIALLLVLLTSVSLAEGRVTDECGLFSAGQITKMEQEIEEIRETYQMDCAVLTTRDIPLNSSEDTEDQTRAYADKYYEDHGYGLGEDRAGILYVIDMRNRVSYVSTAGTMIDYIDDNRQEELLSSADEDLYRGRYGNAALALLAKLRDILGRGIEEGHFRYDEATGERLTGIYNKLTGSEMWVHESRVEEYKAAGHKPAAEPEKPKKQFHFVRDLLICVVVLLLLLFGGYFFLRSQLTRWMESLAQPKVETPVVVEPVVEPEPVVMDTIVPEPVVEEPVVEELAVEPEPYSDLITIEEMHEASRLTWMAKRYYGDKKYWPYLYDANRDVIVNPSRIKVGTPIRVPKLTKEQRDTTNAETKARLEALRIEAEEACRTK